jgi:3alpha(or 20beta)-hydroxysteroid dehydrogenase
MTAPRLPTTGRLTGKTALITGAARGQGAAEARLFAAEGANVLVTDVLDEEGQHVAEEIGERALYASLDVGDANGWDAAVALAASRFGRLDILVNNAGITRPGTIAELPPDDYDLVVAVNQTGPWLGIRAAAPAMRDSGGGSIINISSTLGFVGLAGEGAYVATKWALRGITRTAALELAADGIRVNSVHPGWIDTPMNPASLPMGDGSSLAESLRDHGSALGLGCPLRRIGTPEEVANVVLFLASDESAYCTGAEFVVDGGMGSGPLPRGSQGAD